MNQLTNILEAGDCFSSPGMKCLYQVVGPVCKLDANLKPIDTQYPAYQCVILGSAAGDAVGLEVALTVSWLPLTPEEQAWWVCEPMAFLMAA